VQEHLRAFRKSKHKQSGQITEITDPQPVYLRVAVASYKYGLSRTRLFELIALGTLKSKYIIRPGTARGIRLIEAKSLEAYIDSFGPERGAQCTN